MSDLHIFSNTAAKHLLIKHSAAVSSWRITDAAGNEVAIKILGQDGEYTIIDASNLQMWTPDKPYLYTFTSAETSYRFGFTDLQAENNTFVRLNGNPLFLRGVIRGIVAHDHPNMTGLTEKAAYEKYIRQAKKYGFNLVRFHSTIPDESFVEAADELGFLIHLEIGFKFQHDEHGNKKHLTMDTDLWQKTILRYRNHPSVAIFCIGNEMHASGTRDEVKNLIAEGRELAPGKLLMDNSGWGGFDRNTADIFCQHMAYYLPYKHHANMFISDDCWRFDGSVFGVPVDETVNTTCGSAAIHREMVNQRPVFAHEALHYIEMVDYEKLNRQFDEFCAAAGEEYLKSHDIRKPRYLTDLPALIKAKNLESKMPDYIRGSQIFKQTAIKIYLERLRFSHLCGFEMLQFADCLKYENKNGIVDFFDNDKYIDAAWMRQFNSDAVLLADFGKEVFYHGETVNMQFFISNFLPQVRMIGTLTIRCNDEVFWCGEYVSVVGGLQKLVTLQSNFTQSAKAEKITVSAEFNSGNVVLTNSWDLWFYPQINIIKKAELALHDKKLTDFINSVPADKNSGLYLTDVLDDDVLEKLDNGKHIMLLYHLDSTDNQYILPASRERFKPCIWDRGSNLGGFITSKFLCDKLAMDRYFTTNMQELLENNCKINLDKFPFAVREIICGIDKPVRDRMRGLIYGEKDFIAEDTLRNFSHLFSVKVGNGTLTVCTLIPADFVNTPVTTNLLAALLDHPEEFTATEHISVAELREFLQQVTQAGNKGEDVMNHFWEIDNKPVEDTLFWEEAQVDLSKLK